MPQFSYNVVRTGFNSGVYHGLKKLKNFKKSVITWLSPQLLWSMNVFVAHENTTILFFHVFNFAGISWLQKGSSFHAPAVTNWLFCVTSSYHITASFWSYIQFLKINDFYYI